MVPIAIVSLNAQVAAGRRPRVVVLSVYLQAIEASSFCVYRVIAPSVCPQAIESSSFLNKLVFAMSTLTLSECLINRNDG